MIAILNYLFRRIDNHSTGFHLYRRLQKPCQIYISQPDLLPLMVCFLQFLLSDVFTQQARSMALTQTTGPLATNPLAQPATEGATHVADWPALRLLNQYRIFLVFALAAIYYLADQQRTLGARDAELFEVAHLAYGVFALLFALLLRIRRPSIDSQFYLHNYIDIIFIGLLMYASGGVQSDLGPLLLIDIALLSQLTSVRYALLFAAIASTVVLAEEMFARLLFGQWAADFERTAVLGALLFANSLADDRTRAPFATQTHTLKRLLLALRSMCSKLRC